ncbi:peptide deformylase [Sulfuricurvum sp.]|uniref:peptide deformylase n=1 Tax=Sulfuricurvum sp. TaxID=2025608 RepID=UPI0026260643|nr:peptide deformylase [Sulfuricurvum sp.]MDD2781374.1 peptide deformylase [Sulfuricurvum sp.]
MIQPLLKYPDSRIRLISSNVRFFNDELQSWITDMIDTMRAHDLDALSAILIGIQYNIVILKETDNYVPYINGRLIKHSGMSNQTERSLYYEGISVDVDRYENVTVVYEDEEGNQHYRDLTGAQARIFQQQLDYCYGSTFVDRVDKEMKERINEYLEHGLVADGGSCPVVFYRDYFKRGVKYLISGMFLSLATPFFVSAKVQEWVYRIDIFALIAAVVLMIVYFFYAQYESRLYKQCTSCQTGNIIGTVAILTFQLLLTSLGIFLWVAP